jgi:predicted phage terminase large subunit-like protein
VDGTVTGKGADTLLSDDLISAQDAFSKTKREATHRWYSQSFYNRLQDKKNGRRINVNQRTHQDDVSGLIQKKYSFERLVIPMQKMEGQVENITGWKDPRELNEFMHPSRYGENEKNDEYEGLGIYGWSGQMQQSPNPIGGGIVKDEWIRFWDELPKGFDQKIIVADLAFKDRAQSDYVSYQYWGKSGIYYYLLDLVRGRWNYGKSKEQFKLFCERHSDASLKYVEDKANGPALISELKSEIRGIIAWPEKPELKSLSKVQRVNMVSPLYESGLVLLPRNIELAPIFVAELLGFTENGSTTGNDDMVDTSTMALIQLKTVSRSRFAAG